MSTAVEIPLNEQDKLFYSLECMGPPPFERVNFTLHGGDINAGLLKKACRIELNRYPVFNSVIKDRSNGLKWNLCWVPRSDLVAEKFVSEFDFSGCSGFEADRKFRQLLFDPFPDFSCLKHPPLKIVLCKLPENQYKLIFFFHHASADLAGVSSFVRDFIQTCNCIASGRTIKRCPENDPVPETPQILPRLFLKKLYRLFQAFAVVSQMVIRQKGRYTASLNSGDAAPNGPTSAVMRTIGGERMKRYLAASKNSDITLNSFLVAAHAEALCRWKEQKMQACRTVRIQVHQDLRKTREEYRMFGNRFSPFVIMIHGHENKDIQRMLRNIHGQTLKAKKNHTAEKMLSFLWIFQYSIIKKFFPFCARLLNRPANPLFGDSFTVSNCGRPWSAQDGKTYLTCLAGSEITECFMPGYPVPSIGVFTSFSTFRDKMCLSFSYYKQVLSEEDAGKFIDLLEHTMDEMADAVSLQMLSNT